MVSMELSNTWLDLVLFQVGGYSFALEADQVISMYASNDQLKQKEFTFFSLADLLMLPATIFPITHQPRILEIKCQNVSLLVAVEEPVIFQRFRGNALHPFPEMIRRRLCQPAVLALVIWEEKLITLLDSDGLTIPARINESELTQKNSFELPE